MDLVLALLLAGFATFAILAARVSRQRSRVMYGLVSASALGASAIYATMAAGGMSPLEAVEAVRSVLGFIAILLLSVGVYLLRSNNVNH